MRKRENILDLSRQPLVLGTSCITDETGHNGYKTEIVQASALMRIAGALEQQNELSRIAGPGFQPDHYADGLSHLHMQYTSDAPRLAYLQLLGSTPERTQKLIGDFGDVLQEMVRVANGGLPKSVFAVQRFIPAELLPAFRYYLDHYHDQQEEAEADADKEHYQDWLETHDPGDEYGGRSEHEQQGPPALMWVISEDEDENGNLYELGFIGPEEMFSFALYWGKSVLELEQRLEQEGAQADG